jgi:hypothetical protein
MLMEEIVCLGAFSAPLAVKFLILTACETRLALNFLVTGDPGVEIRLRGS